MIQATGKQLTLEEFLALPGGETGYEFINGEAIPKVSPKRFHSKTQKALLRLLEDWGEARGEIGIEWSVILQRQGQDWVPIPDLLYVSNEHLPDFVGDEPCPVPPELAIEIISPDQTFGEMAAKATDYLAAGVMRAWIVDPRAKSITVFYPDAPPQTYTGTMPLTDSLLKGLLLTPQQVFQQAGLSS